MSSKKKCVGETCCLCSGRLYGRKHTHTERLSEDLQKFLLDVSALGEGCGQCVCRACEVSAKDCMKKWESGTVYKLRWQTQSIDCSVPSCSQKCSIRKHPFSWGDICSAVGIASIQCDQSLLQPLCTNHYQLVYRFINAHNVCEVFCRVCDVKRKHDRTNEKFVTCPNPAFVESFIRDTLGLEVNIAADDLLCFACYKYFNSLSKSGSCTLSSDDIIAEFKEKEKHLVQSVGDASVDSLVQSALCKTAIHVCRIVLLDRAFLFPDVYKVFLQFLPSDMDCTVSTSKSRLLTFLGNEFGDLLTSFCHKKKMELFFTEEKLMFMHCSLMPWGSIPLICVLSLIQVKN